MQLLRRPPCADARHWGRSGSEHPAVTAMSWEGALSDVEDILAELRGTACQLGPWPTDEAGRLRALIALRALKNYPAEALQQLAELAACVADAPMAFVAFMDYDTKHVVAGANVAPRTSPRFETLCAYTITHPDEVTIVSDLQVDPRFVHLRHLGAQHNFRFYAGVPVLSPDGYAIGTLCVQDVMPRTLSPRQLNALQNVAKAITPRLALAMQVEKLEAEQAKFRAFMDNGPALAFIKDGGGRYEYVNQRFLDRFDLQSDDVLGKTDAQLWPGEVAEQLQANDRWVLDQGLPVEMTEAGPADDDGNPSWWQSYKFMVPGDHPAVGGVAFDISAMKGMQNRLEQLTRTDALTQLPNRVALHEHLPQAISRSRQSGDPLAVLFMDIDHFKQVNDTYGHEAGDGLLVEFANRLRASLRHTDMVARLAGDEFVVVLEHLTNASQAEQIAQKIVDAMAQPCRIGECEQPISTSIGVAFLPPEDIDALAFIDRADKALYEAKAAGRNCVVVKQ